MTMSTFTCFIWQKNSTLNSDYILKKNSYFINIFMIHVWHSSLLPLNKQIKQMTKWINEMTIIRMNWPRQLSSEGSEHWLHTRQCTSHSGRTPSCLIRVWCSSLLSAGRACYSAGCGPEWECTCRDPGNDVWTCQMCGNADPLTWSTCRSLTLGEKTKRAFSVAFQTKEAQTKCFGWAHLRVCRWILRIYPAHTQSLNDTRDPHMWSHRQHCKYMTDHICPSAMSHPPTQKKKLMTTLILTSKIY